MRLFTELIRAGGTHVTMEVSSHALALGRVHGLQFHTTVFTNLSQDHLDFHPTMESYFETKAELFTLVHVAGSVSPTIEDVCPPGNRLARRNRPFSK